MREITLRLECIERDWAYLMSVDLEHDKPRPVLSVESTLENGLARRFDVAIRELIEIAKQGALP